jgi:hypothetical protein
MLVVVVVFVVLISNVVDKFLASIATQAIPGGSGELVDNVAYQHYEHHNNH